ncbi:unnamed protein product [Cyprideis torosa]|uniref:Alpha 1,4-glycosyltransferase domain-containing protein n=1 Tax=Cyprideis torosa TaxID=163714 RepID=A0A7R8ZIW9_9CRUS|nr:unnamed protein product [Cyprideis torosa]CAG0885606.1 unnamed protein product [Cyprideis torosa]
MSGPGKGCCTALVIGGVFLCYLLSFMWRSHENSKHIQWLKFEESPFLRSQRIRHFHEEHDLQHPAIICLFSLPKFTSASVVSLSRPPIFFLETSGSELFRGRELCAFESAAKRHPKRDIFVLTVAQRLGLGGAMDQVKEISNLHFKHINIAEYLDSVNSTLKKWYMAEAWALSEYAVNHLSDALRLVLLYEHGGLYLDSDVIVMKSMSDVHNAIGRQDYKQLANGVMSFERGHPFLKEALKEYASTYNPKEWASNGPLLLERLIKKRCNWPCDNSTDIGVQLIPRQKLYAVPYSSWKNFLDPEFTAQIDNLTKSSYLIHVWNKMFPDEQEVAANSPYGRFAQRYCPMSWMFSQEGKKF